jgi:hypothetical protein
MSTPYSDVISIIETLWTSRWPHDDITVIWHHNSSETIPSRATTQNWVHVAIEFVEEQAIAFGQGPGQTERQLRGDIVVRVLSARGAGEATTISLLDDALNVYRSQRSGGLSIIGAMPLQQPGASDDGGWWIRSGIASFTYRFRG